MGTMVDDHFGNNDKSAGTIKTGSESGIGTGRDIGKVSTTGRLGQGKDGAESRLAQPGVPELKSREIAQLDTRFQATGAVVNNFANECHVSDQTPDPSPVSVLSSTRLSSQWAMYQEGLRQGEDEQHLTAPVRSLHDIPREHTVSYHNGEDVAHQSDLPSRKSASPNKINQVLRAITKDGSAGESSKQGGKTPAENGTRATIYRVYKRRWIGLAELVLLNIIVSLDWTSFAPVSQYAASYYSVSESMINWFSTGFMFAFVPGCLATLYMLRQGPKQAMLAAAMFLLVGNWLRFAGSYSQHGGSFGVVMFGQTLCGTAQAFVLTAPTRFSDLWFTNRGRVTATAVASLANPFGAALGQLIVPFMVSKPSDMPRMVLYVAIVSSVCCIPAFLIPAYPPTPPEPSGDTPRTPLRESLRMVARSLEFWLIFFPFGILVGAFNSITSILNQALMPYGFTSDQAGIGGACMIVTGLVAAALASPLTDRTRGFLPIIKTMGPAVGVLYLVFVWMPETRSTAGVYVVLAAIGAGSFILVPVALEFVTEITHPAGPEVTAAILWPWSQILGAVFILICDGLRRDTDTQPLGNMKKSLIFQAIMSLALPVPMVLALGMFGRGDKVKLRRVMKDEELVPTASAPPERENIGCVSQTDLPA